VTPTDEALSDVVDMDFNAAKPWEEEVGDKGYAMPAHQKAKKKHTHKTQVKEASLVQFDSGTTPSSYGKWYTSRGTTQTVLRSTQQINY
jgi:hypothetical protein